MKLTKRGEYALRALIDMVLAREAGRELIPLKEIILFFIYEKFIFLKSNKF
jgi:DNA-binding IscR family transcriptional regulator